MANALLDFVLSLVRDPAAAARYAQDPDQAIADANLTDVTPADVDNLIPVVAESLSGGAALSGAEAADANVWTTGAATAAFDAFSAAVPLAAVPDVPRVVEPPVSPMPQSVADSLVGAPIEAVIEVPTLDPAGFDTPVDYPQAGDLGAADAEFVQDAPLDGGGFDLDDGSFAG
jgi:hypothetical protein